VLTPLDLSALGFGCASVMGKVGKAESLRAMGMAYELGITHFDVARSYGFGRAEEVLGRFIATRRDKVTVTTKFGVVPPKLGVKSRLAMPLARQIARRAPLLRARLKKKSGELLSKRCFDVEYLSDCLEKSLRELRTDYIDIYLLHEPTFLDGAQSEEIIGALGRHVESGKIRRWGLAYRNPADHKWGGGLDPQVIQIEGNAHTLRHHLPIIDAGYQRLITRPFYGGGPDGHRAIRDKLAGHEVEKYVRPDDTPAICLGLALQLAGRGGTVISSMFSPPHIRQNVRLMSSVPSDERINRIVKELIAAQQHDRSGARGVPR
jgi:diketogulonate reductase-like aldo/keto reductase